MTPNYIERANQQMERLNKRIYKQATPHIYGQGYFYVFGWTRESKIVCWGPYLTQAEADSYMAELTDGEVFELSTRNIQKATREIKAKLVERGTDPDEALKRMLHKRVEEPKKESRWSRAKVPWSRKEKEPFTEEE